MDTKLFPLSLMGIPALGAGESGFLSGNGSNVLQDTVSAFTAESQEDIGRSRISSANQSASTLHHAVMPSGISALGHDTPIEALWINEQGQILDCSDSIAELFGYWTNELKGQHISVLLPDLADSQFLQHVSPTTLWVDEQGQILDCSGPIEDTFGYWKNELKGQHICMLMPDLAHTELVEDQDENLPHVVAQIDDASAFGAVSSDSEDNSYSVILNLISAQAGRKLSVILRSQVH